MADVTTGDFYMTEVEGLAKLTDELYKYMPTEIICNDAFLMSGIDIDDLKNRLKIAIYPLEPWYFDEDGCRKCLMQHFKVNTLTGLGLEDFPSGLIASGVLMQCWRHRRHSCRISHTSLLIWQAVSCFLTAPQGAISS